MDGVFTVCDDGFLAITNTTEHVEFGNRNKGCTNMAFVYYQSCVTVRSEQIILTAPLNEYTREF